MITVIDYRPEHLETIKAKPCHEHEMPKTICTRAVTLMNGETPLAIIGSFIFVPGVMHVWAIVSQEVRKTPIDFFRSCIELLDYYEKKDKPRRIQIDIKDGCPELEKWATKIGFKREGLMKAFGADGSDYWMFGRAC